MCRGLMEVVGSGNPGGGFASDGTGQLLVAVGNGAYGTSPSGSIPGNSPPTSLGESSVRLAVQPDGTLNATDFFTPFNSRSLDNDDLDYGSGSPVLLRSSFGTSTYPNLLLQTGKEGYVYLLDAKHLGGVGQGPGGGDAALSSLGTYGGAWTTPAVWPGDGGYVYIPTATGGTNSLGNVNQGDLNVFSVKKPLHAADPPALALSAVGPTAMGFGSSAPVVTSNGTTSGSGVVWIIRTTDAAGLNSQLQAYNATPTPMNGSTPGSLQLIGQWPIGTGMKFTPPGVANNRLFVVTRDGTLLGFGLNAQPALRGAGKTFGATVVGKTSTATLSFTASTALTLRASDVTCAICTKTTNFHVLGTTPALINGSVSLRAQGSFTVKVAFTPQGKPGAKTDVLRLVTSRGELDVPLSGSARAATPWIAASTAGLNIDGYLIGQPSPRSATLTLSNFGNETAQLSSIPGTLGPFTVSSSLRVGATLAPGASVPVTISFATSTPGIYREPLTVVTTSPGQGGSIVVDLTAVATTPPMLSIETPSINFGAVASGTSALEAVTFSNLGGSTMRLSGFSSTNPDFELLHPPSPGIGVVAHSRVTLEVLFVPTSDGTISGSLLVSPDGIAGGSVALTGVGTGPGYRIPTLGASGWQYGGSAVNSGEVTALTSDGEFEAGSAFWPVPVTSRTLSVNFRGAAREGTGGDGLTFTLLDTSAITTATSAAVGGHGTFEG